MEAITTDGHKVRITAHIESPGELDKLGDCGADGIGLLNTAGYAAGCSPGEREKKLESLFLEASGAVGGGTVTVPLFDPPESQIQTDPKAFPPNLKGIRLFLERPEWYLPQLRALLRAGARGRFELALPMVGHVSEIVRFKEILGSVRSELDQAGDPHVPPSTGIFVHVPAVFPVIETILYESGFFIIDGDSLKYLMADQRIPRGEDDYLPFYHHAFLLQAQALTERLYSRKAGVRISGPMVKDPVAVPLLIGLNFDEIIAPAQLIPAVKEVIGSISHLSAKMVASKTTSYWQPEQAREYARERFPRPK